MAGRFGVKLFIPYLRAFFRLGMVRSYHSIPKFCAAGRSLGGVKSHDGFDKNFNLF